MKEIVRCAGRYSISTWKSAGVAQLVVMMSLFGASMLACATRLYRNLDMEGVRCSSPVVSY